MALEHRRAQSAAVIASSIPARRAGRPARRRPRPPARSWRCPSRRPSAPASAARRRRTRRAGGRDQRQEARRRRQLDRACRARRAVPRPAPTAWRRSPLSRAPPLGSSVARSRVCHNGRSSSVAHARHIVRMRCQAAAVTRTLARQPRRRGAPRSRERWPNVRLRSRRAMSYVRWAQRQGVRRMSRQRLIAVAPGASPGAAPPRMPARRCALAAPAGAAEELRRRRRQRRRRHARRVLGRAVVEAQLALRRRGAGGLQGLRQRSLGRKHVRRRSWTTDPGNSSDPPDARCRAVHRSARSQPHHQARPR